MSFFRRMFNNTPEDDGAETDNKAQIVDTAPLDDLVDAEELQTHNNDEITEADDDNAIDNSSENDAKTIPMLAEEDAPHFRAPEPNMVDDGDDEIIELPTVGTVPLKEYPEDGDVPGVTRPLPQENNLGARTGHILYSQATDTGMVRNNNQDAVLSFFFGSDTNDEIPDFGVFVVADGMGGHKEGEKASALTAKMVVNDIFKTIYMPMLNDDAMDERLTITEALVHAVQRANDLVRQKVKDGGTTVTASVVVGDQAYFGHVGDSRAYLIRHDGSIDQITRDHSVVQRLIELDQLTPEEAEFHEQRNVLYRAIGQNEEIDVDILRRRLQPETHILICSDGLWGLVSNQAISEIITNSVDPHDACQKLIAMANTAGGTDNITALVMKIPSVQ